jgi:hypothetical protein
MSFMSLQNLASKEVTEPTWDSLTLKKKTTKLNKNWHIKNMKKNESQQNKRFYTPFQPRFSRDHSFHQETEAAVTWRSGSMAACTTCVPASSSRAGNLTTGVPLKFMEFMEPIGVPPGRTPRKPFRKPDRIGA